MRLLLDHLIYCETHSSLPDPIAKGILVTGFVVQIVFFGVFGIFTGVYHYRARHAGVPKGNWTKCLWTLYICVVLILIRGIFRTIVR